MIDTDSDSESDFTELFSDDEEVKKASQKEKLEKYFLKCQSNSKEPLELFQTIENYLITFKEEKKINNKNKKNKIKNNNNNNNNSTIDGSIDSFKEM